MLSLVQLEFAATVMVLMANADSRTLLVLNEHLTRSTAGFWT